MINANVMFALSNAEFDYGRRGGGLEKDKKRLRIIVNRHC